MLMMADLANTKWCKKMTETLPHRYSSESTQLELSNEYQHDRDKLVFKILCILVLWMKVRRVKLALEELDWIKRVLHSADVKYYRVLISPPQVESGKQSAYRFLKVLSSLREWEICSPDIMAAIEYCRDRIIDMTVEDYEEWFRQQFPKITRPQTAPPLTPVKLDKSSSSERVWIEKYQ